MVKNLSTVWETWVRSLGWDDPLEEGMATHSSILAWITPWTDELGGYSLWCRKESDMTEQLEHSTAHTCVGLPWWLTAIESACSEGDVGSVPGVG